MTNAQIAENIAAARARFAQRREEDREKELAQALMNRLDRSMSKA